MREPVEEKQYTHCHQLLPASQYGLQPFHPTGLQPRCRECSTASKREERARNAAVPLPAVALATVKYCTSCQEHLPRPVFSSAKGAWDGLYNEGKGCNRWRNTAQK